MRGLLSCVLAATLAASASAVGNCPGKYVEAANFRCYRLTNYRLPYDPSQHRQDCFVLDGADGEWVTGENEDELLIGTASFKKATVWTWSYVAWAEDWKDRIYRFTVNDQPVPQEKGKPLKFRTRQTAVVWSKKSPKPYEKNSPHRAFLALCRTTCSTTLTVEVMGPRGPLEDATVSSGMDELGMTGANGRLIINACPGEEVDLITAELFGYEFDKREVLDDGTLRITLKDGQCPNCLDRDKDGIPDDVDNCPDDPNPDQLNTDEDQLGDACDPDKDGDTVPNVPDNCPLVPNYNQADGNGNGIGDACDNDSDGDGIPDHLDACPFNANIGETDFTGFDQYRIGMSTAPEMQPNWILLNNGKDITQTANSDPAMAIGMDSFDDLNFEGTLLISDAAGDDDYIGFVFGFQSPKSFYTFSWKKRTQRPNTIGTTGQKGIQVKLINCIHRTRCSDDDQTPLRNALFKTGNSVQMVSLIHHDESVEWEEGVEYRWKAWHRPSIGLIRVQLTDKASGNLIADTGNLFDSTLAGGRAGVYVDSQENTHWKDLEYKCGTWLPGFIWDSLPSEMQNKVEREPEANPGR